MRDEAGNIVKWYGSATDIEDRKRIEAALRQSEERFRDYAETASDWFWETGPDHRVVRVSDHLNAVGAVPSHLTGVARWDIATDVESEPDKWRLHRATHDAHLPLRATVRCAPMSSRWHRRWPDESWNYRSLTISSCTRVTS